MQETTTELAPGRKLAGASGCERSSGTCGKLTFSPKNKLQQPETNYHHILILATNYKTEGFLLSVCRPKPLELELAATGEDFSLVFAKTRDVFTVGRGRGRAE
ncbi:Uncharacterized protein Fot_42169 [Forsythia ovata]|uniref:Nucleoplasmin-like domain-containing protein n=1 Tax=Forsythia ovata TaxID=205694 RepID=A0ABD1RKF8_9LAMI